MSHKSNSSKSFGEVVGHWGLLASGLTANAADLPHLDGHRAQLTNVLTQAQGVLSEQKIQTAGKQDLSRKVETLLDQGSKLATFLRAGVKQHYGHRSEKLVEFDLLPFRGKAKPVKPPVAVPPTAPPIAATDKPKADATHPGTEPAQ